MGHMSHIGFEPLQMELPKSINAWLISLELTLCKKYLEFSLKKSFVSFKPKYLWIILSMFVSIARTFSPYANERIAFFVQEIVENYPPAVK